MKFLKTFDIEVIKFKEGHHEFDFDIDETFFGHFEDNEILDKGSLTVRVLMDKGPNLIELEFHIQGTVELTCDRSLEVFDHELETSETMIYKYGPIEQEIDENVSMITRDTPSINVAQLIYEFILLALPAKKIHPDHRNELDDEDYEAEGGFVYIQSEEEEDLEETNETEEKESKPVDPRWEQLLKLKNKEQS
ncbi:YceD family protein [Algoriphagus taiwanensis]|uniref:YceD family protein n=1 Tax=Algoriphagus taiwanensis TaxID=1445656 RepID=UPI0030C6F92F